MKNRQKRDEIWFEQNIAWRLKDETDQQKKLLNEDQVFKTISSRVRRKIEREQFAQAVPKGSLVSVANRIPIGLVGLAVILLLALLIRLPHFSSPNPGQVDEVSSVDLGVPSDSHLPSDSHVVAESRRAKSISESEAKHALAIANAGLGPLLRTRPNEAINQLLNRITGLAANEQKLPVKRKTCSTALNFADGDQIVAQVASQILGISDSVPVRKH